MLALLGDGMKGPLWDRPVDSRQEHSVKDTEDTCPCFITGSQYLQDGTLIVCDRSNGKLKRLTEQHELMTCVQLPSFPWDTAVVSECEAVVTLPYQQQLQFVTMETQLTLGRSVAVGKKCWGVAARDTSLYVTCHGDHGSSGEVVVLTMQGVRLQRFCGSSDQPLKFAMPSYIAVDAKARLYVSDLNTFPVTCLSGAGDTVYTYRDAGLRGPGGLMVDADQNVYVCGSGSRNIQVISADGRKVATLLSAGDGLLKPSTLEYRARDSTLVVGLYHSNKLVSFRFQGQTGRGLPSSNDAS